MYLVRTSVCLGPGRSRCVILSAIQTMRLGVLKSELPQFQAITQYNQMIDIPGSSSISTKQSRFF